MSRVDPTRCSHRGGQICPRCSWTEPRQAAGLFLRGRTARTAVPVALVVGTILSAVNQGDTLWAGRADTATWVQIVVNYAVPFIVASIGYLAGRRVSAMEDKASGDGWAAYLARFHQHRAGITERLLARTDRSPYAWLADAVRDDQGPVLDLACGSAPTRPLLPSAAWVGVDSSFSELELAGSAGRTPLVQAKAQELPVRDRAVGVVCAALCLQVLTPLDPVLAEVKRVLAPGASLVALVPSSRLYSPAGVWRWLRILRALGLRNQPWPNPKARDGLARVLGNHGFVVDADDRAVFDVDVSDPAALGLLIGSLYLPGVPAGRVATAKRALTPLARPGRTLPMPLRRVVAHCPAEAPP